MSFYGATLLYLLPNHVWEIHAQVFNKIERQVVKQDSDSYAPNITYPVHHWILQQYDMFSFKAGKLFHEMEMLKTEVIESVPSISFPRGGGQQPLSRWHFNGWLKISEAAIQRGSLH